MTLFRRRPVALVFMLLLLAGCAKNGDDEKSEEEVPPIPVEVSKPTRGDVYAVYTGTASIEAFAEADVIAKVAGEVRRIYVEEGDEVEKGRVLAKLDGDRLRLELNESRARLNKLEREYERNVDLREKGLLSEGDFERIKFEMEALQASYNLASLELDYTQIRAPIDGVVSERYIKVGRTLSVNDPVFRVTGYDPLVAYLHIPGREFDNIDAGQVVAIDVDALSGAPLIASVTRVGPTIDPVTGTFKATIEISNERRTIKPGMFARINVVYDRHENVLQVPRSAIVEDLGSASVFVVEDDVAESRPVETGYSNGGMVEVISGLGDDDRVVVIGQLGLKPDSRVSVINSPDTENGVEHADAGPQGGADDEATD